MRITDVENMTAAEIKIHGSELISQALTLDATELARRYVQARLDAKLRDEKLAEQGEFIKHLEISERGLRDVIQNQENHIDRLTEELAASTNDGSRES